MEQELLGIMVMDFGTMDFPNTNFDNIDTMDNTEEESKETESDNQSVMALETY